jgi:hypothetical protein
MARFRAHPMRQGETMEYIFKIDGMPTDKAFRALTFARQLDYRDKIAAFKATAKSTHWRAKDKTTRAAFLEFKRLYRPSQWYLVNRDAHMYHDDSFEVWYVA